MAALSTHTLTGSGAAPVLAPGSASDTAVPGPGVFAVFKNAHASEAATVTLVVPGNTAYGAANPDPTFTVAANGGERWIPLTHKAYRDPETGRVTLTSADGTLSVAIVKVV